MTKMGQRRQTSKLPLKRKTLLSAKKGLNKMSIKAKEELIVWMIVKQDRMMALLKKFNFVPCEYCKESVNTTSELYCPEAHHNNHDRRDNRFQNCRIVHRVCNQEIEDKNVKDVPSLLEE